MCDICRRYRCPPNCPSYKGWSAEYGERQAICTCCGVFLYAADDALEVRGRVMCVECGKKALESSGNRIEKI